MKKEKVVKNTDIESSLKADELSSDFASFYQGQITNSVTAISKKSKHEVDPETQAWLFPVEELGGGKVVLENADKNELTLSSAKLLDTITLVLTGILPYGASDEKLSGYLDLELDVYKYMKFCGLQDKNQTVKQMKKDLEALFNASTTAKIIRHVGKKEVEEVQDIRFIDEKPHGQIRDTAKIHIALSFACYLTHNQIMQYPLKILLSSKNPNTYYIGKRLAELFNMNQGKTNEDSINIENLLKFTPNIPTLEEEKGKGRHYRERCIQPLENTLDELQQIGFLSEWYFMKADKQMIPNEELHAWSVGYNDWKQLYVHFVIKDYPLRENTTNLIEDLKK